MFCSEKIISNPRPPQMSLMIIWWYGMVYVFLFEVSVTFNKKTWALKITLGVDFCMIKLYLDCLCG